MQPRPGEQVDRYEVLDTLGQGGMAVVYRVRHSQLGSIQAMKVLTVASDSVRERLLAEGRAQSSLRHPNVVSVTDVVQVRGLPALVMEYVDGPALDQLLAAGPMTFEQVDVVARGILRGVAAAHRHGLVHRDLKPGNILLSVTDGEVVPKVTDFGLAKMLASSDDAAHQTRTGATMGTPAYMAPEQIRDASSVDERADVFSLGAVLYEMLTGTRPFEGSDSFELMRAITDGRRLSIDQRVPQAPERMRTAVEAALVVDRSERLPSIEALLEAWTLDAQPLASVPDEPWYAALVERTTSAAPEPSTPPTSGGSASTLGGATFALDDPGAAAALTPPPEDPPEVSTLAPSPSLPADVSSSESIDLAAQHPIAVGVAATLAAVPLLLATLAILFGDVATPLQIGGPLMLLLFPLAAVACGTAVALGTTARRGTDRVAAWWVLPALTHITGTVATYLGLRNMWTVLPNVEGSWFARLAASGSRVAMVTDITGLAFGALALGISCLSLAWAYRPAREVGLSRSSAAMLAIGLLGGTVLALAHPWLSVVTDGPAPWAPFLTMVLILAASALLGSSDAPRVARARWLLAGLGLTAVVADARTMELIGQYNQFLSFIDLDLVDGLEGAAAFTETVESSPWPVLGSWAGLTALALAIGLRGTSFPFRLRELAIPVLLIGTFIGVRELTVRLQTRTIQLIEPAYLAGGARWHLGFELESAEGDLIVRGPPEGWPAAEGDSLVAVERTRVADLTELLITLRDCRCPTDGCTLVDTCLETGSTLELELARADGGRLETVTVPWLGGEEPQAIIPPAPDITVPLFDFVMEPNAEISERTALRDPGAWDPAFVQAVEDELTTWRGDEDRWRRMAQVYDDWATVLRVVREAGLPDVLATIPWVESRYAREKQSDVCSKGIWSFMPEVGHRLGLRIEGCRFEDDPEADWAPTATTPPRPVFSAIYVADDRCRIPQRRGCRIDERTDPEASTRAAVQDLGLVWQDDAVRDSGAAVQLTLVSHLVGYDDSRFGVQRPNNVRPALAAWIEAQGETRAPDLYGGSIACQDSGDCDAPLSSGARRYIAKTVAAHFAAVCFYGLNEPEQEEFRPWARYADAYCASLDVPQRAELLTPAP